MASRKAQNGNFYRFFADFDQKTQKLHQNKPGIGIAHRFYIEKGITGVISGEVFFFQAEDGIRDLVRSRGLGDVYKRQYVVSLS